MGLVWGELEGEVRFHPDEAVTSAIGAVFAPFSELGSVRQVWLWFRSEGLSFPLQSNGVPEITDYEVCGIRVPDQTLWVPSLVRHEQLFGRAPRLAVADAGFASRTNERAAYDRGVRNVVLPRMPRGVT